MSTHVEKSIMVNVPVSRAYNQWTQFEDFPQFMSGVQSVTQLGDDRLEWVAEIAGVRRQWEAQILEQVPDRKVSWAATAGATNAGSVGFEDLGGDQTSVTLVLDYEPEGLVEKVGDKLNVVENQAEGDLTRFKEFIESEGYATGAWRGSVAPMDEFGTPDVSDAAASRGDSGKAGLSGKAVAAGLGVAAVAAAAAAHLGSSSGDSTATGESDTVAKPKPLPTPPPVSTDAATGSGATVRMLTDDEVEAGASDTPPSASEAGAARDQASNP